MYTYINGASRQRAHGLGSEHASYQIIPGLVSQCKPLDHAPSEVSQSLARQATAQTLIAAVQSWELTWNIYNKSPNTVWHIEPHI